MAKTIVYFFPGNNVEEEKDDEKERMEENKHQEEDKIRTTMQSSIAMTQSCTIGIRQLFHLFQ